MINYSSKPLFLFLTVFILSCKPGQETPVTIEPIPTPSDSLSSLPYLVQGANNQLYLSWVEKSGVTSILNYSVWSQNQWTTPESISQGADWFVNWADYPMLSANKNGDLLAHFLVKNGTGTYAYDVNIVQKSAGSHWGKPLVPHHDDTPTEHGFVTVLPLPSGTFQVAWLDGRNTGGDHHDSHGAMSLRTAILNPEGEITEEYLLDDRVCDCCQTSGALTASGPVIIYRDRSAMEIRDISIVRKVNGTWTSPQIIYPDNWKIAGCPVNGPRAASVGNTVAVAWFSAARNQPEVKVIFSEDGGETFGQPITIDKQNPSGRVDVIMLDKKRAMVSWLAKDSEKSYIKACEVSAGDTTGKPIIVSATDDSRGSGFPQMELHEGAVFFAWTAGDDHTQVKSARLKLKRDKS